MRLVLLLFVLSIALSDSVDASSTWAGAVDDADRCTEAVTRDGAFAGLGRKLVPEGTPNLDQLTDDSIASAAEIELIRQRSSRMLPCREIILNAARRHHPLLVSALEVFYFQADMVYVQLIKQRITFGNANKLLRESGLEYEARERAYFQAQSDQQRQEQAERDRRLADQARRWRDSIDRDYPPGKVTTCSWNASMLVCM